jgi:uncharacterized protein
MTQNIIVTDDGREFIDMDGDDNPCVNCGACCNHYRVSFYQGELSEMPMGFVPSHLTTKINNFMACMKGTEIGLGKCVALTGEVGIKVGCSIYDKRPTPCREFNVWDSEGNPNPRCQELRQEIGLPLLKIMNNS